MGTYIHMTEDKTSHDSVLGNYGILKASPSGYIDGYNSKSQNSDFH
jgi:hypothetical protein